MALNTIQAKYMTVVQAAVPALVPEEKLVTANSIIQLVNSFSNMAGMAIAGILFAGFGLMPILVVSAVCFAITAVMDLFIRIPFVKQDNTGSIIKMVKGDIVLAARFMFRERPIIARAGVIAFMFSATLSSMIIVGIPVLVTQHLGMGMNYVGISQSVMMGGGLLGGILAGVLGGKLKFENIYLILIASGIAVTPIGIVMTLNVPDFAVYLTITVASALSFALIMPANILLISYVQGETPGSLVGKVMSLLVIIPFLANALGQLVYGVVFEWLESLPWLVVFVTVVLTILAGLYTRKHFRIRCTRQAHIDRIPELDA
jgi:MFS family permease